MTPAGNSSIRRIQACHRFATRTWQAVHERSAGCPPYNGADHAIARLAVPAPKEHHSAGEGRVRRSAGWWRQPADRWRRARPTGAPIRRAGLVTARQAGTSPLTGQRRSDPMHNPSRGAAPSRGIRPIRVRWHAENPPMPLGCRWCGHPPYAHEATSLPHRPHHDWEQPTPAQVHARMTVRRRLGLCGRPPAAMPVRPLLRPEPPAVSLGGSPAAFPGRSPAASPGRHRRQEHPVPTTGVPNRRGWPPTTRIPSTAREPYRKGAAA
jgi:hypothetical protein